MQQAELINIFNCRCWQLELAFEQMLGNSRESLKIMNALVFYIFLDWTRESWENLLYLLSNGNFIQWTFLSKLSIVVGVQTLMCECSECYENSLIIIRYDWDYQHELLANRSTLTLGVPVGYSDSREASQDSLNWDCSLIYHSSKVLYALQASVQHWDFQCISRKVRDSSWNSLKFSLNRVKSEHVWSATPGRSKYQAGTVHVQNLQKGDGIGMSKVADRDTKRRKRNKTKEARKMYPNGIR